MQKPLPKAETYNNENDFMPWGELIDKLVNLVCTKTPKDSTVLDLMCGTGFLIKKIKEQRPDLQITGIDINEDYIKFALDNMKDVNFICADTMDWPVDGKYDLVLCTGGIHHIGFKRQQSLLIKMKGLLSNNGVCITADPFIGNYVDERSRKLAANELGSEYIRATIEKDAPRDVVKAAIDILDRDIALDGEYKTSIDKFKKIAKNVFSTIEMHKVWPKTESEYGDYYFILT